MRQGVRGKNCHWQLAVQMAEHYTTCAPSCMKEGTLCQLCSNVYEGREDMSLVLKGK